MGVYPGVEASDEPDEVDVLDAGDVVERFGAGVNYVDCVDWINTYSDRLNNRAN
jgi:hypothetical protein